jgi:RNA polymerase sigma-70 factor, ECF subfamily
MIDWDSIVAEHGPMVWQTVWRLLANLADVEECFQETFLGAFKFSQHNSIENWPGILCSLASARALDRLRKRYRHAKYIKNTQTQSSIAQQTMPTKDGPVAQALENELSERLRIAISQLPKKQAEAFYLHAICGWSYREIGSQMNTSEASVGVNIHRARENLQSFFNSDRRQ